MTFITCGKTGIRTLGTRKGTTVFETVPIDRSGIFPRVCECKVRTFFLFDQILEDVFCELFCMVLKISGIVSYVAICLLAVVCERIFVRIFA